MQEGWGAGIRDTRPHLGHLREGLQGIPVFLLSQAQVFPQLRYCHLKSDAILLPVMTQPPVHGLDERVSSPSCRGGLLLGDRSAFKSPTGLRPWGTKAGFLVFLSVLHRQ